MSISRKDILVALLNFSLGIAGLLLVCSGALAARPGSVSSDLDPVCILALGGKDGAMQNVTQCDESQISAKRISSTSISFVYRDEEGSERPARFDYQYAGRLDGRDVLLISLSDEKLGTETHLVAIEREGKFIKLAHTYAAGFGCRGGISNAVVSNGVLSFDRDMTPSSLIALTNIALKVPTPVHLDNSDNSCAAKEHFSGEKLTQVTLSEAYLAGASLEGHTDQSWFNIIYKLRVSEGRLVLNLEDVLRFGQTFYAGLTTTN